MIFSYPHESTAPLLASGQGPIREGGPDNGSEDFKTSRTQHTPDRSRDLLIAVGARKPRRTFILGHLKPYEPESEFQMLADYGGASS